MKEKRIYVFDELYGPIDEKYLGRFTPLVDKSNVRIIEPPTLETDSNPFYNIWIEEFGGVPHNYRPS